MTRVKVRLDQAQHAFEGGEVKRAARIIHKVRADAIKRQDSDDLAVIDGLVAEMRAHLEGEELERFDWVVVVGKPSGRPSRFKKAPPESDSAETPEVVDVSPAGLVLASLGAGAMVIAVFLPYADASSTGFFRIEKNTLIQNGAGWAFIVLALLGTMWVFAAYTSKRKTWAPIVTGLLAIAYAVYFGSNGGNSLQLCSVLSENQLPGRESGYRRVLGRRRRRADGRRRSRHPRLEEGQRRHRRSGHRGPFGG